jgi:hypothetical protein
MIYALNKRDEDERNGAHNFPELRGQKLRSFIRGKAISGAPIIRGTLYLVLTRGEGEIETASRGCRVCLSVFQCTNFRTRQYF